MSVKKAVLAMLETHRAQDISGEQMAQELGVSRAAVWKAINSLKAQGYPISATTNRGYRLGEQSDLLSAEGIRPHVMSQLSERDIFVFETIDSTNLEAKRRAMLGGGHFTAIVADQQTMGRGRFGRSFFSPPGCGVYMSLLLKPTPQQISDATLLTTAAAVAVCHAIEALTPMRPEIKWVNDIYLDGKKLCGILTEAVTDLESGAIESVVIGLGINFKQPETALPEEVAAVAGTLFGAEQPSISRNRLVAEIINRLFTLWGELSTRAFLSDYRSRSMLLGQEIVFSRAGEKFAAIAEEIDDDGALVVRMQNGERVTLRSGEVSVRPVNAASTLPFVGGCEEPAQ
ncbi:biotin--[acetyl-CoA-carboxylase] ligase [Oscillospiraceae bacterium LTW-04]|nr:biotin--[acetyl-CoA-carboxylase] ligase [Oscillospiraceae bacterium MB24-C1]